MPRLKEYSGNEFPPHIIKGKQYRSFKHPALEYIFFIVLTDNATKGIGDNHTFTLQDISRAYRACGIKEPASISNTILDLTRKDAGVEGRVPASIATLGYDLRKKTGRAASGKSYAGEFVYVGQGKALSSWLVFPSETEKVVVPNKVPPKIAPHLGRDEGALFSVIDYCDALSLSLYGVSDTVLRVQNPMKWQPNEIDGLYFSDYEGVDTLFCIEAKALSTGDSINLEQMLGGYRTIQKKRPQMRVVPVGAVMIKNGVKLAILRDAPDGLELERHIHVVFEPSIDAWK